MFQLHEQHNECYGFEESEEQSLCFTHLIIYFFYIVLEIKRIPYKKYSLSLSSFVGPHECRVPLPYTVTISLGYPSTIWGKITKFEIENIRNKVIGERQQTTSMFLRKLKIKCIAKTVKNKSFKSTELRKWKKLINIHLVILYIKIYYVFEKIARAKKKLK